MREFCTDRAIACGEPLAGTGAIAKRHLFLRWPKGRWRRPRFESEGLPPELTAAMRAATQPGSYVGLIAGDGEAFEFISFPEGRRVEAQNLAHAVEIVTAWGQGTELAGAPSGRPAILCCTDAKTDACCARYGFPLFKALIEHAPAHDVDIFQTTHIGGCHFAPSVVAMPDRRRYGRLTPAEAPAFLQTIARGEIYIPAYKGDPQLSELEQCAEVQARHLWSLPQPGAIRILSVEMHGDEQAKVSVEADARRIEFLLERATLPVHSNCRDLGGPPKPTRRWQVIPHTAKS
jgi:hypothetical protein